MIVYGDILGMLAQRGWTTKRLQEEHKLGNGTIIQIRGKHGITTRTINTICELCDCQPGDFMTYIKEEEQRE